MDMVCWSLVSFPLGGRLVRYLPLIHAAEDKMPFPERLLVWFLRGTAIVLISAAAASMAPYAWMNAVHGWLGLGVLPDQPIVAYLTRSLSALYACVGVFFWCLSRDVKRYLSLLRCLTAIALGFAVSLFVIDAVNDLPAWWTLTEAAFLLAWTLALWSLARRVEE